MICQTQNSKRSRQNVLHNLEASIICSISAGVSVNSKPETIQVDSSLLYWDLNGDGQIKDHIHKLLCKKMIDLDFKSVGAGDS